MLVQRQWRQEGGPYAGTPLPQLQPVETPTKHNMKGVRKLTGRKAGRSRHVQISELRSRDEYDQAVLDFLVAIVVGKFLPKLMEGWNRQGGRLGCGERQLQPYILSFHFCFFFSFYSGPAVRVH